MAKASSNIIPIIDLSPFFNGSGGDDEDLMKKKAKEVIDHACSEYGFFQIVNHGVPLDLMTRALELSEKFFDYPNEEKVKLKSSLESSEGLPIPAGYTCVPEHGSDKKYEYLITFRPGSSCNLYPDDLPEFSYVAKLPACGYKPFELLEGTRDVVQHRNRITQAITKCPNGLDCCKALAKLRFPLEAPSTHKFYSIHGREVIEEIFAYLTKTGLLIENILNECLDLPPNFLKEYNNDRSWDLLTALRYFPTTDPKDSTGLVEHQDANVITFLFHAVGGLEVLKDEEWIPVTATNGSIIVNLGDAMQVLSNKKYRSATHRVMKQAEKYRHSYAFFYTLGGDKWVEPLPKFSKESGEPPKYKGFFYKDYQKLRRRNKISPPPRPEDVICINHFAITN